MPRVLLHACCGPCSIAPKNGNGGAEEENLIGVKEQLVAASLSFE